MSTNMPPFNPPPSPTPVRIERQPPPGPSPYVAFPDLNAVQRREEVERNYWTFAQRPGYFLLTALVNLIVSTFVVFKALRAMYTFDPAHWVSGLLFVCTVGLFAGVLIMSVLMIVVLASMNGLSTLLTGKGLFPLSSPGGSEGDDVDKCLVGLGGVAGVFIAGVAWVVAGMIR